MAGGEYKAAAQRDRVPFHPRARRWPYPHHLAKVANKGDNGGRRSVPPGVSGRMALGAVWLQTVRAVMGLPVCGSCLPAEGWPAGPPSGGQGPRGYEVAHAGQGVQPQPMSARPAYRATECRGEPQSSGRQVGDRRRVAGIPQDAGAAVGGKAPRPKPQARETGMRQATH
jgi:hypothetical protein